MPQVLCKSQQLEYATEVGKDNRISIVLESATPMAGGAPSFAQLQASPGRGAGRHQGRPTKAWEPALLARRSQAAAHA